MHTKEKEMLRKKLYLDKYVLDKYESNKKIVTVFSATVIFTQ